MQTDFLSSLSALLNLPDLVILTALLINLITGLRRGFFRSLYGLAGKTAALAAAFFAARWAAPSVAGMIVTPIVGEVFEKQAALAAIDGLQQTAVKTAASMAESIAFLLLLILFGVLFGWAVTFLAKSLHFIAHLTPLGILDSLAGGAVGLVTGILLIALVLVGVEWFSPITYTTLGYLSPQRVADTVILKTLIDYLPVAI